MSRAASVAFSGADGAGVILARGTRISWASPCGIGGVTIRATVSGVSLEEDGQPGPVCFDVEPNAELRAITAEIRAALAADRAKFPGRFTGKSFAVYAHKNGLDGGGGSVIATGDAVREAVLAGRITVIARARWPRLLELRDRAFRARMRLEQAVVDALTPVPRDGERAGAYLERIGRMRPAAHEGNPPIYDPGPHKTLHLGDPVLPDARWDAHAAQWAPANNLWFSGHWVPPETKG